MFCALSGEVPQNPVFSKKSGALFERDLILKYIKEHGKDPVTSDPLSDDDITPVKLGKIVKPRPPTVTSIPTLLSLFQNEWDALVLESYQLKLQLHQTRMELSNSLYENDAAKRVIARLVKERDDARTALASMKPSAATTKSAAVNGK